MNNGITTIKVRENTRKKLQLEKQKKGLKSVDELIARKFLGGSASAGQPMLYRSPIDREIKGWEGYNLSKEKLKKMVIAFEEKEKELKERDEKKRKEMKKSQSKRIKIFSSKDL